MNKLVANSLDLEHVSFNASEEQQLVKARFWEAVKESPVLEATDMSVESMCRLAGGNKLRRWLQEGAFRSWFFNENAAAQKIQAAAEVAVDTIIGIMHSEDSSASTKLKAALNLIEFAGLRPAKKIEAKVSDADVENMSEDELRSFIFKSVEKLKIPAK
jgi:hypothetical protein